LIDFAVLSPYSKWRYVLSRAGFEVTYGDVDEAARLARWAEELAVVPASAREATGVAELSHAIAEKVEARLFSGKGRLMHTISWGRQSTGVSTTILAAFVDPTIHSYSAHDYTSGCYVWRLFKFGFALCFVPGDSTPGVVAWFSALEDSNVIRLQEIVRDEPELDACVADEHHELVTPIGPLKDHRALRGWSHEHARNLLEEGHRHSR